MTLDAAIERIQFAYPQVYYACHTRHARKKSSGVHLSARDSQILVHLDRATPTSLSTLARHMDLAASTLSEAVTELAAHGYVVKTTQAGRDRRQIAIVLTPKGATAVRSTSVLEAARLKAVLQRLPPREMAKAVNGLVQLAKACMTL